MNLIFDNEMTQILVKTLFICTMENKKKSTWDYMAYCIYSQTSHSAEINLYIKQMLFW